VLVEVNKEFNEFSGCLSEVLADWQIVVEIYHKPVSGDTKVEK
jgi:hypothetical protein